MICPVCKSELKDDAKFCNNCGFEIGIEKELDAKRIKAHITRFRLPNFTEEVEITGYDCPLCGYPVVRSIGEYGPFCALLAISLFQMIGSWNKMTCSRK